MTDNVKSIYKELCVFCEEGALCTIENTEA